MKHLIYIILLISLTLFSCTELIKIDLADGNSNRLVVEGSITNELKIHAVTLSRTGEYFLNQPTKRELNANVSISDGDTLINLFDPEGDGTYETDKEVAGKLGHTYTLDIELSNGEKYSASETIKPVSPLDSIKYEYKKLDLPFDDDYYYHINMFAQESPTPNDYYQWELYLGNDNVSDTVRLKNFVTDELVNGSYITNWTVYTILAHKIVNDIVDVRLQMLSISKEKYEYYQAILLETDYSGGGFSGPPSNVPTNISNGALGFFSASAVTEKTMKLYRVDPPQKQKKQGCYSKLQNR